MLIIVVILVCVSLDVSYQELDGSFFFTVFLDSPISTHANKKIYCKNKFIFHNSAHFDVGTAEFFYWNKTDLKTSKLHTV